MARRRRHRNCKGCGKPREVEGKLSARGLCHDCGLTREIANIVQLHQHSGPYFDHWRRQCLAAFGVTVIDADPPSV